MLSDGRLIATMAWLADIRAGDAPIVEAADLGELICLGYKVPAGFVITVEAYLHTMEDRRGSRRAAGSS